MIKKLNFDKFEEYRRVSSDKLDDCLIRIKDILKRYEPTFEQINVDNKIMTEKTNKIEITMVIF